MLAFLQNGGMCRVVGGLALLPVAMLTGFLHAPVWVWVLVVVALPLAVSHAVARKDYVREMSALVDDAFDEVDRLARYRWWVKGMEGHAEHRRSRRHARLREREAARTGGAGHETV